MQNQEIQGQKRNHAIMALMVILVITALSACGILLLEGCSPQTASDAERSGNSGATTVAWSEDMECTSCHVQEVASEKDTACLASKHVGSGCESCHGTAADLAEAHANASASSTMPTKLSKKYAVSDTTCLSCHDSWEALAEKTNNVTTLTDETGTVVNPHAIDRGGDHQVLTCVRCHSVHVEEENQMEFCLSCHHEDVFECYTCHE